jgi:hypothetical protein
MHSTNDLNDGYYGSGTYLQRSLEKHGKENHKFEILEYHDTRESLRIREQEFLTEGFIADPLCMNIRYSCSAGNDPGFWQKKDRAQTAEKISQASKEMWARRKADPVALAEHIAKTNKPEHIIKRSEAIKAKRHKRTPEQLERLSRGQSEYYSSADKNILKARGRKGVEKRAKTWIVEDQAGNRQEVKDLMKFSSEHGIAGTALYKTEATDRYRNGYRVIGRLTT